VALPPPPLPILGPGLLWLPLVIVTQFIFLCGLALFLGAQILLDLWLRTIRPITNNPRKLVGLEGYGLRVEERVPIVQPEQSESAGYMRTKRDKLGHLLAS